MTSPVWVPRPRGPQAGVASERAIAAFVALRTAGASGVATVDAAGRRSDDPAVVHLRRAKDLADRHFAEPITLDDLARVAACSRWHLVRVFKEAYGETPGDYLSRRRIERAMELLRETDMSVTDVCNAVSFSSLGTFSRRFRALVGSSPSQYRRAAREREAAARIPA